MYRLLEVNVLSNDNDPTCSNQCRLTYVRTIDYHQNPVECVTISDTMGDIASVSYNGYSI